MASSGSIQVSSLTGLGYKIEMVIKETVACLTGLKRPAKRQNITLDGRWRFPVGCATASDRTRGGAFRFTGRGERYLLRFRIHNAGKQILQLLRQLEIPDRLPHGVRLGQYRFMYGQKHSDIIGAWLVHTTFRRSGTPLRLSGQSWTWTSTIQPISSSASIRTATMQSFSAPVAITLGRYRFV
jgi:hypothetical protein